MALGIGDCYNASYGNPVDYPVYLEEEGLLDLALTEEQVGKAGRRWLLFHNIKVLTISDRNESVGDSFAEGSYCALVELRLHLVPLYFAFEALRNHALPALTLPPHHDNKVLMCAAKRVLQHLPHTSQGGNRASMHPIVQHFRRFSVPLVNVQIAMRYDKKGGRAVYLLGHINDLSVFQLVSSA